MTPTPDQTRTGDGKERILLAALEEFAARGYDGASTTVIARRSGVTQPLIHYHFGSKEGLWRATVDEAFRRLGTEFFGIVQASLPAGDPRATFLALLHEFIRFCARYPQFPRLIYTELPVPSSRSTWLMDTWVKPVVTQVTAMLEAFAGTAGMRELPPAHVVSVVTGAATAFFAVGDFWKDAYGIDATDPAVVERHAQVLLTIIEKGLFEAR